jgi:methyl-accepting chemotaxis protein
MRTLDFVGHCPLSGHESIKGKHVADALKQQTLATQISLTAGSLLCAGLLLSLPVAGWIAAGSLRTVADAQPGPASQQLDALLEQQTRRTLQTAEQAGLRLHEALTDKLLLHDEQIEIAGRRLPLITHRDQPLHQHADLLDRHASLSGGMAAVMVRVGDEFLTVASSQTNKEGGRAIGEVLNKDNPAHARALRGEAYTGMMNAGDQEQAAYWRPLKNSAGDIAALLVLTTAHDDSLSALITKMQNAQTQQMQASSALRSRANAIVGGSVLLAVLLGLLGVGSLMLIARRQLAAIRTVTATVLGLGSGDLAARISIPGDDGKRKTSNEITLLARSINRMAQQLSVVMATVKDGTGRIVYSASDLSAAARQLSDGAQRESHAASGMAAAVEEMTTSIACVGQNAEEAKGVSQRAHELASEGSQAVASATEQMRTISETVESTSRVISELSKQSQQISAIAAMIKEIAEQTNLLALNAAIEAARAGENGRGFSVVADEVRRLAERTSDSTEDIRGMIDAIQASADTAVGNMQTAVSSVGEGVRIVENVGATIAHIHEEASQVAMAVDAIHIALREQNTASSSIAQQVDCIANMSRENQHTAEQSAQATSAMEEVAAHMMSALEKFAPRRNSA